MPEIEIQFRSEAEYRRLRAIRDKYGVQWRGMLGAKRLEAESSDSRSHRTIPIANVGSRNRTVPTR
ncbi:hypothetical protein [Haloplanus litoreus]|uniref:Transposase n=1 Tax=Haloplanus litoreus TaxID=767515 RepID=A0ABD6A584_9EURY